MSKKQVLYIVLSKENFTKLMSGKISKMDYTTVSLNHSMAYAIEADKVRGSKGVRVICELLYDTDTLIQFHFDGKVLAPMFWLIEQGIASKESIDPEDLERLESLYSQSTFDFHKFQFEKSQICRAFSFGKSSPVEEIYNKN